MKMTSMDINGKEFKRVLRGYNPDEVDEFLEKIADDYEELYKENSSFKEKLSFVNEKLEHYSKIENTIQNTLLMAQNAAEQSRQSAQKEAEVIIGNANLASQKILDKANSDVSKINEEYDNIKHEFVKFRSKFKTFMGSQMDIFNTTEKEFIEDYNIGEATRDEVKEKEIEIIQKDSINEVDNSKKEIIDNNFEEIKSFYVNEQ